MTTMQGSGIRTFFLLIPDRGSEVTASEFILLRWWRGYSRECGASLLPAVGQELRFALTPFVGSFPLSLLLSRLHAELLDALPKAAYRCAIGIRLRLRECWIGFYICEP